jgi:hypothetical protein
MERATQMVDILMFNGRKKIFLGGPGRCWVDAEEYYAALRKEKEPGWQPARRMNLAARDAAIVRGVLPPIKVEDNK